MQKKLTAMIVCVLLAAMLFAGCGQQQAAQGAGVTDMLGNTVEAGKVEKIVSLTPAGTEIVYALGMGDKLVGVDAFSNYPAEVRSVEIVGDFNGPDVEKVVSLEPDIVLAGNTLQQEAIDQLSALGIKVACIEATAFGQVEESYRMIGALLGAEGEAAELGKELRGAIAEAKENAPAQPKTVYYAMSYGDAGNWTSGPGSFINDMIALAGGAPVVDGAGLPNWVDFPIEDLVAADPDIILVDGSMGAMGDISRQTGYKDLTAVKNGKVYEIDADVFTRPGPRLALALAELGKILNEA